MINVKTNTSTGNFLLLQKLAEFGHIYHKIFGYSDKESADTNKKREKFSRSQENKVRRMIL
jgi:hypothetical protein